MIYRNLEQHTKKLYQYTFTRDVHVVYHLLQAGKGFYFTEIFGVYRLHDGGVFSSLSSRDAAIFLAKSAEFLVLLSAEHITALSPINVSLFNPVSDGLFGML
jgi:hypothetical protein